MMAIMRDVFRLLWMLLALNFTEVGAKLPKRRRELRRRASQRSLSGFKSIYGRTSAGMFINPNHQRRAPVEDSVGRSEWKIPSRWLLDEEDDESGDVEIPEHTMGKWAGSTEQQNQGEDLIASGGDDLTELMSFDLYPFQILYVSPSPRMHDMKLLEITMHHVTTCLQLVYSERILHRVEMFRLIRTEEAMPGLKGTGMMVAYGGEAQFSYLPSLGVNLEELGEATWMAFLGARAKKYLMELHDSGFADVERVEMYTLDGSLVYLDDDGVIRIESDRGGEENDNEVPSVMDDMGLKMLIVAIGIPVVVFMLVCVCYGLLHCRGFDLTPKNGIDPMAEVWQSKNYVNGLPRKQEADAKHEPTVASENSGVRSSETDDGSSSEYEA